MIERNQGALSSSERSNYLLGVTSLFEKSFSIDWIIELVDMKVSDIISILESAVHNRLLANNGSGVFFWVDEERKTQLMQEQNEGLHGRIAHILMRVLQHSDETAKLISYHLQHIHNDAETAHWLIRAGDVFKKEFRTEEAVQCYAKVLKDLYILSGYELDKLYVETAIKYSKISTARHSTKEVMTLLQGAMKRARKWDDQRSLALLEMHMAKNKWLASRYQSSLNHFERGWSMAKRIQDARLNRSAVAFSTFFLYWQGRYQEAVQSYENSIPEIEKYPDGKFPILATITMAQCYAFTGHVTQALGMLDAIGSRCVERGDLSLASNADGTIGSILLEIRRVEEAIDYLQRALETARQKGNYFLQILGELSLSYAYYLIGNTGHSISHFHQFIDLSSQVKITVQLYPYVMELFWDMETGNLPKVSDSCIKAEINRTLRGRNVFLKGVAYRYEAMLKKRDNITTEDIIKSLKLSIKFLAISGHKFQLAKSQLELANQYALLQKKEEESSMMNQASNSLSTLDEKMVPPELRSLKRDSNQNENLLREILKLGQEAVQIRDDGALVQHIISTGNRLTGAERGAIFLFEEEKKRRKLVLKASKNLTSAEILQKDFLPIMNWLMETAAKGKGRLLCKQTTPAVEASTSQTIKSRICVPMILREKVVGVLYHDNSLLSSAFKESDLDIVAYFAALAAIALDNMKAYKEIQRLNQRLIEENLYFEEKHLQSLHFEDIVGESAAIKNVMALVRQVADTDSTVLILGETGVGKELIASAIHKHSLRSANPFIRVNCSALPESLIPSELFGHEKGAFTGANQKRTGRFELANNGTLFLDEIGDLPLDVQVRLLRVLQSKEFERVGGIETLRSDFRLLVATNKDLQKAVGSGKFREDLYYRINVFPIHVPPLRERKEDIPLLAHYFLQIYSKKMGKEFSGIPDQEVHKLVRYDWPGNVRELENIIERGTILNSGPCFRVPELGRDYDEMYRSTGNRETLKESERRHILWAVEKTGWKIRGKGGAAELLDIHPSTLSFRMKKLGIERPKPPKRLNKK